MKILAIETSCDETAISVLECQGRIDDPAFSVLAEVTVTQLDMHRQYGGVVPMLAKREHQKALMPILVSALQKAGMYHLEKREFSETQSAEIKRILVKEPELYAEAVNILPEIKTPDIDAIAVTHGPGLEPALWVGVNFAKVLSHAWAKPIVATNHMEGHIYAGLAGGEKIEYPALALLVSGGHTELVLVKKPCEYEILGSTRDDAVGEAFDKVARILGLPYPGGPQIASLAGQASSASRALGIKLPRPMKDSGDLHFSFSGLKTAVLYLAKELGTLTDDQKIAIAHEFQEAAIDVLLKKSADAIAAHDTKTFIIGGGVSANRLLRQRAAAMIADEFPNVRLSIPSPHLSTDNATMIAVAGYLRYQIFGESEVHDLKAQGNLKLA